MQRDSPKLWWQNGDSSLNYQGTIHTNHQHKQIQARVVGWNLEFAYQKKVVASLLKPTTSNKSEIAQQNQPPPPVEVGSLSVYPISSQGSSTIPKRWLPSTTYHPPPKASADLQLSPETPEDLKPCEIRRIRRIWRICGPHRVGLHETWKPKTATKRPSVSKLPPTKKTGRFTDSKMGGGPPTTSSCKLINLQSIVYFRPFIRGKVPHLFFRPFVAGSYNCSAKGVHFPSQKRQVQGGPLSVFLSNLWCTWRIIPCLVSG